MNPIYKFELNTVYGGTTTTNTVYPLYKDDLAKEYEIEQNQRFYRKKLSGKLQFVGADYDLIDNARFESKFVLVIYISWDAGQSYEEYLRGEFWKTDCKVNADNKVIEVTPSSVDDYTEVLAGLEKEYNLIELKPEINQLNVAKRPLVQVYVPGESIISCFLSTMNWEQDCDAVDNEEELVYTYYFAKCGSRRFVDVISAPDGFTLPSSFIGPSPATPYTRYEIVSGEYKFVFYVDTYYYGSHTWQIYRVSDNVKMWEWHQNTDIPYPPHEISLAPVSGSGATGYVRLFIHDMNVYARLLCDVERFNHLDTKPIPSNDLVPNNRNYRRVIGWEFPESIHFSDATTNEPTEWGIKNPGEYYVRLQDYLGLEYYPIGRSHWGNLSIWFYPNLTQLDFEVTQRKHYVMKNVNPLHSVISVLLGKIAPGVTHEPTAEYSRFLYSSLNPISGDRWYLYLTQKSNVLAGDYQEPAQKAPITLKMITDMLRQCFCAYWFIEDGKFKIEHISWFKNGGSYSGTPAISHDLTVEQVTRNGKKWAFETSQYEFEKPTLPERYQFGWMDDVTSEFEGKPIEIKSQFVQRGNIEEIKVNNFTSDIDYMLLNPGGCSQDGFALLAAVSYTNIDWLNYTSRDGSLFTDKLSIVASKINVTINLTLGTWGNTYHYRMLYYNGDTLLQKTNWFTTSILEHVVPTNATSVVFEFAKKDGTTIDEEEWLLWNGHIVGLTYSVPIYKVGDWNYVQNPYAAFPYLQDNYYGYDLPAYHVVVNGQDTIAYGIMRNKRQTIKFPVKEDPDELKLIKTYLGNGQIQKISINLSNRNANATLMYDTYEDNE